MQNPGKSSGEIDTIIELMWSGLSSAARKGYRKESYAREKILQECWDKTCGEIEAMDTQTWSVVERAVFNIFKDEYKKIFDILELPQVG